MSHFWARFQSTGGNTFRLDTRIYLKDISAPMKDDQCIGAIVGKNPGSAKPSQISDELQPIELDGDKLLPTVRNIITKAYLNAHITLPCRGYIQVLNLFYLCNNNLSEAIRSIKQVANPPRCPSELSVFPWVWYVWGDESNYLNTYKDNFSQIKADHYFFFDKIAMEVKGRIPHRNDFAKHTQGLKHDYVVPYFVQILSAPRYDWY